MLRIGEKRVKQGRTESQADKSSGREESWGPFIRITAAGIRWMKGIPKQKRKGKEKRGIREGSKRREPFLLIRPNEGRRLTLCPSANFLRESRMRDGARRGKGNSNILGKQRREKWKWVGELYLDLEHALKKLEDRENGSQTRSFGMGADRGQGKRYLF